MSEQEQKKEEGGEIARREMTIAQIEMLISKVEAEMQTFMAQEDTDTNLSSKERQRLTSARVRNNGFIDKAFDIAHENPEFMPPHFNLSVLQENERRFEMLRQLMVLLEQFEQLATDAFMLQSNHCYKDALRIYRSLQEQAKGGVAGAERLFQSLRNFFSRKRRTGEEPTEHELDIDLKKLEHGKADGEIILRNESPKLSGGVHEAIDSIHTGRSAFDVKMDGQKKK